MRDRRCLYVSYQSLSTAQESTLLRLINQAPLLQAIACNNGALLTARRWAGIVSVLRRSQGLATILWSWLFQGMSQLFRDRAVLCISSTILQSFLFDSSTSPDPWRHFHVHQNCARSYSDELLLGRKSSWCMTLFANCVVRCPVSQLGHSVSAEELRSECAELRERLLKLCPSSR